MRKFLRTTVLFFLCMCGIFCISALSSCADTPTADTPDDPTDTPTAPEEPAPLPKDTMTVYVDAAAGDDQNSGAIDAPLATLTAAQTLVRDLHKGSNQKVTVTVYLRAGTYTLAETFKLTGKDS